MRISSSIAALLVALPGVGCACRDAASADDNLNATVWVQTSAEYEATCRQVYASAIRSLPGALGDDRWTACLEQELPGEGPLPPAVIVDVDETILDNSAYQAWLIETGSSYGRETWFAWCRAAEATPVPGALAFCEAAAAAGVVVLYVTNRSVEVEEPTRRNLARWGFPLSSDLDVVLSKDERPEWTSEKGSRRRRIAERYRVLLLVGDNLGDFVDGVDVPVAERAAIVSRHSSFWGQRWFMLPNPTYGSWEQSVLKGSEVEGSNSDRKRSALQVWGGPTR